MATQFDALWVTESDDKTIQRAIVQRSTDDLPSFDNAVLIQVQYSSLNYKDALSATGNRGVTRQYPHTPGIDAAGTVVESADPRCNAGDEVLVTGYDLGMNTCGGYGQYIRVPADWVVALPDGLSLRDSMLYGTAGFTAAISVQKLLQVGIEQGEVLVTGATGGVGSIGVGILAKLGFSVVAVSGKADSHDWLKSLGAQEILGRESLADDGKRPLLKGRFAGVLDTVGGGILATALKSLRYNGAATCCGLVASPKLDTSVFPFILRGVSLLGVDSVEYPTASRPKLWQQLASAWRFDGLESLLTECDLEQLNAEWIEKILAGQVRGRVVVKM